MKQSQLWTFITLSIALKTGIEKNLPTHPSNFQFISKISGVGRGGESFLWPTGTL